MLKRLALLLGLALVLTACGGSGGLNVNDAWARPALAGNNAAIYLVIDNDSPETETLLRVESELAAAVELHQSMMLEVDDLNGMVEGAHEESGESDSMLTMDDGVMQMVKLDSVEVGANQQTVFEPGGLHVMLVNLAEELQAGDQFDLTMIFQNSGTMTVTVEVEDR